MAETILDGTGEQPAGHRLLDGTDLEIAYNLLGDHLVLRVNKGPSRSSACSCTTRARR